MKEDKTKIYNISDLKNESYIQTILGIWNEGYRTVVIIDSQADDDYKIYLSESNEFKIQGLCFLNGQSSFQADFNGVDSSNHKTLASVINAIAGGEIITDKGRLIYTLSH